MRKLVIVGGGTAGTILANRASAGLGRGWQTVVIDPARRHLYQPDLVRFAFGDDDAQDLFRPRRATFVPAVDWMRAEVESIDPAARAVRLRDPAARVDWDVLVIATGAHLDFAGVAGTTGPGWRESILDFYTVDGATALRRALGRFRGGRLVVSVAEGPIKSPLAPLEFLFLADEHFRRLGLREAVDLVYATPLAGPPGPPATAAALGALCRRKQIAIEAGFAPAHVDGAARVLHATGGRALPYQLLVSVPPHRGAPFLADSGLVDERGFVTLSPDGTSLAAGHRDVYALGDAAAAPLKAGAAARLAAEALAADLVAAATGRPSAPGQRGSVHCFVDTGWGRGVLVDLGATGEAPAVGTPPARFAPFTALVESRRNHWGKLGARGLYWRRLLGGVGLPLGRAARSSARSDAPRVAGPTEASNGG